MRTRNPALDDLAFRKGIVFDQALDFLARLPELGGDGRPMRGRYASIDGPKARLALDEFMASDAVTTVPYNQPAPVTTPNAGIPAFLTTFLDPKLIQVLLSPMKAEEIYGVTKKGDWLTDTAMFAMVENTGEAAVYGDFNENGRSGANVNYPFRQSLLIQTITEWGERELERMGLGKVDWAAQQNIASANTLNRFMNLMYFFGVSGLQNYGGLNDPALAPALTPATKVAGGTGWQNALPTEILADFQACFASLQGQTHGTGGNLDLDAVMTVGLHPISDVYLANTNSFGLTAIGMVKKVFPNIKIVPAVQYLSGTTYSMQMIVDSIEGQRTCEAVFTEKMRAHPIIQAVSSWKQKKTAGGFGTIFFRPIGVASMAGI